MKNEFTYAELDAMRAKLAKMWRQTIDQVTEDEARYYLRRGSLNGLPQP